MYPNLRFVLAILAGIVSGGIVVALVEAMGHFFFPPPDTLTPETFCAYAETAPLMAFVFPLIAWAVGAVTAGIVAKLIYRVNNKAAFIAGAVQLIFVLINFFVIPCHPYWMMIIGVLIPVPMAMLGSRLLATH